METEEVVGCDGATSSAITGKVSFRRCQSEPELVQIKVDSGGSFDPGVNVIYTHPPPPTLWKVSLLADPHNYKSVFEGLDLVLRLCFGFRSRSGFRVRGQDVIGLRLGAGDCIRSLKVLAETKAQGCVCVGVSVRVLAE